MKIQDSQKQLPNISKTPQAKSQPNLEHIFNSTWKQSKQLNDSQSKNVSNISYIKNEKTEIKQDQFYSTPLLTKNQLQEVERQSKSRKNELYSQMLSDNPFKFNDSQDEINERPKKVSSIHVNLFDLKDKDKLIKLLKDTSDFSDKLSQHNQQNKPANVLIQRQDVIKLAQWIDFQLKIIINDPKMKEEKMLQQIEQVFNYSLKELVREISLDCLEKGVLLEKIWNQYVNFNNVVLSTLQQEKNNQESEFLSQMKTLHQTYQQNISEQDNQIKDLESQLQSQLNKFIRTEVHHENIIQQYENLIQEFKILKEQLYETKNELTISLNDREKIAIQYNTLAIQHQKIEKQLNDQIEKQYLKQKRQSYIFQETDSVQKDHKYTSCYDLISTMEIHVNRWCQTDIDYVSHQVQTDQKFYRNFGTQYEIEQNEQKQVEQNQTKQKRNIDEIIWLKEQKEQLEEKLRLQITNYNELKKQNQQFQRENEQFNLKIISLESQIGNLTQEISTLQEKIDNNNNNSNKTERKREITIVSMDKKNQDHQMTLVPQFTTSTQKTQQQDNQILDQQNQLKPIKKQTKKQIQEVKITKQQQNSSQKNIQSKVRSVDSQDSRKVIKTTKNSQIIPRKQSQESLIPLLNNSQQDQDLNTTEGDFLNKALDELTKDGKILKLGNTQNQKISIVQQRRQNQQQNYLLIQQERQLLIKERLKKDKQENIYVDVALAFINQLSQDFKQDLIECENTMTIQNALKLITQFYREKLDSKYPLYAICYEYYMNSFGLRNIAEQKMTQFCQSLITYQSNYRIKLFGRFLQLYDNISNEDLEFYIQSLVQLDENNSALNLLHCTQQQDIVYVKLQKVQIQLQILNDHGQTIINKLIQNIKMINDEQYIDLDQYFLEAQQQFQLFRKISKDNFNDLFLAIDANDDQTINIEEFNILYDLIEGQNDNTLKHKTLFKQQCEQYSGLHFYQFGMFCLNHNLFTQERQIYILNINGEDNDIKQIKINWGHQRKIITERLKEINLFNSYYQNLIRKLDEALKNNLSYSKLLWKILDEQTKRLKINYHIKQLIGESLIYICERYEYIYSQI